MPFINHVETSWVHKFCESIVCQGRIPKHVGLILDGNRRYAKRKGQAPVEGHREGYEKLKNIFLWSRDVGIEEITAYVFSIENFKRPQEELDDLFKLMEKKLTEMFDDAEEIMASGICIQYIGDWSLCPPHLMRLMSKHMILTRPNSKLKVNFAFSYTSRNEIARGVESLHWGIESGQLLLEDINEDLLGQSFQLSQSLPLDLIIRTSGETRLSDFLLWQSTESVLHFTPVLWPEFNFLNFLAALFQYQKHHKPISNKLPHLEKENKIEYETKIRQQNFIKNLRIRQWKFLENHSIFSSA